MIVPGVCCVWPVGLTISHCVPPELVLEDTVKFTGVPVLVTVIFCGAGIPVPSWKAKFSAVGFVCSVGIPPTVRFTWNVVSPDEVLTVTVPV